MSNSAIGCRSIGSPLCSRYRKVVILHACLAACKYRRSSKLTTSAGGRVSYLSFSAARRMVRDDCPVAPSQSLCSAGHCSPPPSWEAGVIGVISNSQRRHRHHQRLPAASSRSSLTLSGVIAVISDSQRRHRCHQRLSAASSHQTSGASATLARQLAS